MKQSGKIKPPDLGARIEASGYMVRYSTMRAWREANPDTADEDAPSRGFKTWKRKRELVTGVFVGVRRMTIKRWWFTFDGEMDFHSELTPIVLWLVAYSARANPRYVLPRDVLR